MDEVIMVDVAPIIHIYEETIKTLERIMAEVPSDNNDALIHEIEIYREFIEAIKTSPDYVRRNEKSDHDQKGVIDEL